MITTLDKKRIMELLINTSMSGKLNTLEKKLDLSIIVESEKAPSDLVTMNSEITIYNFNQNEMIPFRLVYQVSPLYGSQASILAPLGTAALGMRINEKAKYRLKDGQEQEIQILGISFQPEAKGMFEL